MDRKQTVSKLAGKQLTDCLPRKKNKDFFQSIALSAPVGIGFVVDGVIHWTNEKVTGITGYTRDELEGKNACMLFPDKEEFDRVSLEKDQQLKARGAGAVDTQFKRKDGAVIDIHLSFTPFDQENWSAGETFIAQDITERKKMKQELIKSKKEWERTFDAMPDIVTIQDRNLTIIRANQAASSTLGKSWNEIVGHHCFSLFRNDDTVCRDCPLIDTKKHFFPCSGEIYHEKLDKTFLVSAAPILDDQSKLEYIIHVAKDISDLKKSEIGRLRLAAAIDQVSEIIMISDSQGNIQYVNPAFEKTTGFTCEEAIGQNCCFLSHGDQNTKSFEKMCSALHGGQTWSGSLINVKKDGSSYEEEATFTPVKDNEGRITNFVAVKRDVSREKSLEKQLRQAVKMEAIGTLAGGIAHDFNNILSAILGYSEMARAQLSADDPVGKDLDRVIQSGYRATDLVKQILTFSRQEEGDFKPFKAHLIIKEVLKLLRSTLPATIELQENVATDCRPILVDSTQLHQVLMNLCTNAKHAIGHHTGKLQVALSEIEVTGDNDIVDCPQLKAGVYLDLEVSDTGCGMDEVTLSKVFDPFFTTKKKGEGTGLGLAVVHGIIKQHKGEITVSSELDQGTTFHIYLPIIDEECFQAVHLVSEDIPKGNERLLIVDDEQVLGQLMQRMLKSLGYSVSFFSSSVEAWEVFKSNPEMFDLVITDMTMPEMTGIDLAGKLLDLQPGLPVILCTGFSEAINEMTVRSFGICEYVTKPVDKYTLAKVIRKALGKSLK
ncbi:hypothetical protein DGMP_29070 [Desulfomarina profundi]|uniref:histidine kinase n=1 Tax=Desulfomarina profundi TaxID=2772557 RepID=A0A8D5FV23_9BACT|nr:PAS domain S-box protein [Desulfomarina profundi]BCL62214.1 hypothetical protein DGMP_29070 [Desulfomarina profundi]